MGSGTAARASAVGGHDSANATSPHSEIVLGMPTIASGNSYGNASIGVQAVIQSDGYKLLIGHVHQNIWPAKVAELRARNCVSQRDDVPP